MTGYRKGLTQLDEHCFAYLQPDGGWGWSNAGLVTDGDRSLLVDTLFDLHLTREMLEAMAPVTAAAPIATLVNTHANGDHCFGNELVDGAEIVASVACAEEMPHTPPQMLATMMEAAGRGELGDVGDYLQRCFSPFDFDGITLTLPTRTFEGRLDLTVGNTTVELIEVGPAHTRGDVLAHVPAQRTIFTGDILFIDGTPLVWAGPVSNWIAACDLICGLDVEHVVPGHGPVTDKAGVGRVRDYLAFVEHEARARHAEGMSVEAAAADIQLGEFAEWIDRERIAINVDTVYHEIDPEMPRTDVVSLFSMMAKLAV
jgi:cyclase